MPPKGYTIVEQDVPNPAPITGYEDNTTYYRGPNGEAMIWQNGNTYTKDDVETPTTEWVQNYERHYGA